MKTIKMIGYAGIASVALVLLVSSVVVTEAAQVRVVPESAGNLVHRVSSALAAETQYTATASGYKWGQKSHASVIKTVWSGATESQSGYKWGKPGGSASDSASSSYAEQAANPWGRRNFSEQAANPWGRRDFSEQAANPWGRR